jgi:putative ABC transport system permease protein
VLDVREAQVWVMDSRVRQADQGQPISDQELYRIRSIDGVDWAVPYYRGTATLKSLDGALSAVTLIGVDNQSLIGLPPENRAAAAAAIRGRNAVVVDSNTAFLIFPDKRDPIGQVAEINDNRVIITGMTKALTTFAGLPIAYMKYTDAISITPPFVLATPRAGVRAQDLADRITQTTGLKALTRDQFAKAGVDFIINNTGIPLSFGIAIGLGVVVAIVITALTLAMFITENLKNFGALKAIGVTNGQILTMVMSQAFLVGLIGYGIGIGGTAAFIAGGRNDPSLAGFNLLWQVVAGSAVVVFLIVVASAFFSVRRVLKMDPAIVFRG